MKHRHILIIIFLLFAFQGITQVKPFRFGVKLAPNLSWISPDTEGYEYNGMQMGFSWGFLADITLTENYFIKTGFNIDYQNAKLRYEEQRNLSETDPALTLGTLDRKYKLQYLEIPITLKMRTNKFGEFAFYGEIGFGAAFNLKAKAQDKFYYNNSTLDSEADINDEITLMKGSLIVGAGLEYFIDESTTIVTSLIFSNGLTNILNGNTTIEPIAKQRGHLYSMQLCFGIMF